MTYEEIVKKAREAASQVDVSDVKEHLAYQINIEGEGEGAFYIEVKEGKIYVEPYEYYDRDVIIFTQGQTMIDILEGKKNAVEAFFAEEIRLDGDIEKAIMLQEVVFTN